MQEILQVFSIGIMFFVISFFLAVCDYFGNWFNDDTITQMLSEFAFYLSVITLVIGALSFLSFWLH